MNISRQVRREAVGPLLVAAAAVAVCGLQSVAFGLPIPAVHDEFSYLLAADTFLHGRCTNPKHPLWQHFETIHVLQEPTYASKYPPGQGLFLAAGRLLGGHPVAGVWIGMGLACGAATWMLRAFVPRWWAVCGGLLMVSRMGFSEWGWGYMGGGVAAAGGALFIGGWARVLRRPGWLPSTVMAVGLALLAVSRPFEGLLLCLPVGLTTLVWLYRRRFPTRVVIRQFLVPALAVLLPATLALGYYNYRVTGSPFHLPYLEHAKHYDVAPALLVQAPYPIPKYRHETIRDFHVNFEFKDYLEGRTYQGWVKRTGDKLRLWWRVYLGYGLSLSLLALPWVLVQSPRTRFAALACAVVFGVVATLETWGSTNYTAPVTGLLYLLVVQGFRRIALLGPWRTAGRRFVVTWLVGCLLVPSFSLFSPFWEAHLETIATRLPEEYANELRAWLYHRRASQFAKSKSDLIAERQKDADRHLVIVRYGPGHSCHEELVYNDADIDDSKVVWAREMGPEGQARLLRYFKDRTVWLLTANQYDAQLQGPWKPSLSGGGPPAHPPGQTPRQQ